MEFAQILGRELARPPLRGYLIVLGTLGSAGSRPLLPAEAASPPIHREPEA